MKQMKKYLCKSYFPVKGEQNFYFGGSSQRAISILLCTMYFQRSIRVETFFTPSMFSHPWVATLLWSRQGIYQNDLLHMIKRVNWTFCCMTKHGGLSTLGVQVRNIKMVFNICVHLASGQAMNTNDENLWYFILFG